MSRGYMSNREWSTWKRRLTVAQKQGPAAVVKVEEAFMARADDVVLPDDWARFRRAGNDAWLELSRTGRLG